jgi:ABC-type nitrate/sulfonate/bicarbonate transport system substrate-binding protein
MKIAELYRELGSGSILTAWSVTRDYSAAHPDVVRAFARAWREASLYTNAHHGATVDMMADFTAIPADVIAKMPRATATPTMALSQLQTMIDDCAKYGALKASFPAADLIDPNVR